MSEAVPIGILSVEHVHASAYAALLSKMDAADFVGVADSNPKHGRSFAAEFDTDYMESNTLLEKVEGVLICAANEDHLPWVKQAASAGVDILCEKPLSTSKAVADDIIQICDGYDVDLGVAMPLRHSVPAQRASAALEHGDIGELRSVVGTNRGKMPGGWFVDPEAAGGGAAMDHTVHIVDLIHWITGERVTEVYAELDTRFYDLNVEDVNVLSMKLSDGTQFSLDGSWSRPEHWDFWGDATVELIGTDGVLSVDCFDETFKQTQDTGEEPGIESIYWGDDPNASLLEDFIESIQTNSTPLATGEEGRDAVAVLEAVYESAHRGEPTDVTY
ncbi:Gfo/Idh/MocA family protein [Haloferax sp. DFSO52]|uniref:Gfo/Idh/MocA family protein n=1 Tax=Haloferax sp. DFSO52 TaxID=3388505 RepID=UPI003A83A1DE